MLIGYARKLSERRAKKLKADFDSGDFTLAELAEDYRVSRATIYRTLKRNQEAP